MRSLKNKIALVNAAKEYNIKQEPLDLDSAIKYEPDVKIENQTKLEYTTQAKVEYIPIKFEYSQERTEVSTSGSESSPLNAKKANKPFPKSASKKTTPKVSLKVPRTTKNIVKNYAQAICKFALSSMATDYLLKFTKAEGVSLLNFLNYVKSVKTQIESLHHFRSILLITNADSSEIASYKRVVVQISKTFVKFFSVNWIYHSKVVHKEAHLKYRLKMLRRIENPELFTYLKI